MLSGKLLTLLSMSRNFKMMEQSISVGQLLFEQSAAHWAEVNDIRIDMFLSLFLADSQTYIHTHTHTDTHTQTHTHK